ncbi:MAG TPA: LLM class flavin-dependent oxidoreductase [Actinomycetota bacterium]|nr:LLM class flavin-dependent oxidoreductase [Actinomycetota bacterium]
MRIGLVLPMASRAPDAVTEFARRAEELAVDGVFAFDHLFPPGAPPDRPSLESMTTLAAVATATTGIGIGTLVARASLRSVGVLAKQVVTLDDLSGGRFVLGIGTGDRVSRAEHDAFGLPYLGPDVRRAHLGEAVAAIRALSSGRPFPGGDHVPAVAGPLRPAPRTPGGPPIWIGGVSEEAVRLAARQGDGWNAWGVDPGTFASRAALLRAESRDRDVEATWGGAVVIGDDRADAGRRAAERRARGIGGDAFVGDPREAARFLGALARAGASWAVLLVAGGAERLEVLAERVLPRVGEEAP